jgi:hypothetical protein
MAAAAGNGDNTIRFGTLNLYHDKYPTNNPQLQKT